MTKHYIYDYLLNPTHRVTVSLIGCGGTGSQVLSALARMNEALLGLGHPGFHVTVYDADNVDETNVGRQLYSPVDIGQNKAVLSVTRVNRFFGYDWDAEPVFCNKNNFNGFANFTITCVDSAKARIEIAKLFKEKQIGEPHNWQFYWLDFGNLQKTGQVVLGTISKHDVPLKKVTELFNLSKVKEKNQGHSCSIAQALGKQDLFINSTLAQLGMNILWKLFREAYITHHGCYLNLNSLTVNPIKI